MPDIVHSLSSLYNVLKTEECSEPCQTTKMGLCGRIITL